MTEVAVNSKKLAIVTADDIVWKDVRPTFEAKSPVAENRHKVGLAYVLGADKDDEAGKLIFLTEPASHWQWPILSVQVQNSHDIPTDQNGEHLISSLQVMLGLKAPLWRSANGNLQWRLGADIGVVSAKVLQVSHDCYRYYGQCSVERKEMLSAAAVATDVSLFRDRVVLGFGVERWMKTNGGELTDHLYFSRYSLGTFVTL
jgi:hypothetical protein